MKNNSTPSEGWEERIRSEVKNEFPLMFVQDCENEIVRLVSQEIAKARQEVYDEMECGWDICLTNAQYERCVEVQVKKARQETRQEIKEWVESYNKRSDGINKSDLLKELEEETNNGKTLRNM